MKVTSVGVMETHAIVGGNTVRSFAMSDSAEFFTVLSSTLYSKKRLAVIREVLCNAWDAHIATNKKHIAVKVTLTDEKIIIRDYGTGIPDDEMVPIYCVYGGSTKLDSESENGGFGFGSKAPFAYTNHFTVSSMHKGLKTVYAVSRGSKDSLGKPDLRPLVTFDTDETGLEVTIPLEQPHHQDEFKELIEVITSTGDMHVELNGKILPTLPYDKITNNYLVCPKPNHLPNSSAGLYVRLGTVIYPIPEDEDYHDTYRTLSAIIKNSNQNIPMCMIIRTEPNTITITPSRESIEMTDQTKSHITKLLTDVIDTFDNRIETIYSDMVQKAIKEVGMSGDVHKALKLIDQRDLRKTFQSGMITESPTEYFTDPEPILKTGLTYNSAGKIFKALRSRIDSAQEDEMILGNLIRYFPEYKQVFRDFQNIGKNMRKNKTLYGRPRMHDTEEDRITRIETRIKIARRKYWNTQLLNKINKAIGTENEHRLVWIKNNNYRYGHSHYELGSMLEFEKVFNDSYNSFDKYIDPNNIAMAYNRTDILDIDDNNPDVYHSFGYLFGIIVLRRKGHQEEVTESLEKAGFKILDNCYVINKAARTATKKKLKGYVPLLATTNDGKHFGAGVRSFDFNDENHPRIENPKHVFHRKIEDGQERIFGFGPYASLGEVGYFLKDAVVVPYSRTADAMIAKGVNNGLVSLATQIKKVHDKDPFNFALLFKSINLEFGKNFRILMELSNEEPKVKAAFSIKYNYTEPVQKAVPLLNTICNSSSMEYDFRQHYLKIKNNLKLDPALEKSIEEIESNEILQFLNLSNIRHSQLNKNTKLYDKQIALVIEALKG